LRRLLRRSLVYGKLFDFPKTWVLELVNEVITIYATAYSELLASKENIQKVIAEEEAKFSKTLEQGLKEFKKYEQVSGKDAFYLFQSFGIPWEITEELAKRAGMSVNRDEFEAEFKKHQELSRTASAGTFKGGLADHSEKVVRLHTVTHLMQAALRKVLGEHVLQKGSNITAERTRFDFIHDKKMRPEEITEVERLVNEAIQKDLKVVREEMPQEQARTLGAIGAFGEKYGDIVSVYTVADDEGKVFSREFCGGPHVEHTGSIGKFKITKEEAVSAGVRRIKAVIE
jgi:alanyl-tRNA synthetase